MQTRSVIIWVSSFIALILYGVFASSVRNTEMIWFMTRLFGLLAFFALFIAVALGEIRLLAKVKAKFGLFRFHTPMAIFSTFLVFAHGLAAVMDNYKWGKGVPFVQYLGFSFSDKWLFFLSFGTLAFYLMLVVGLTSGRKAIQKIGFKRWKLVHYFSYLAFIIAYIHSVNLGTDIKTSFAAPVLSVVFVVMFFFIIALLVTRIIGAFGAFADQWEINLAAAFFLVLLVGGIFMIKGIADKQDKVSTLAAQVQDLETGVAAQNSQVQQLQDQTNTLQQQTASLSDQINQVNALATTN